MATGAAPKIPLLDSLALRLARLYYRRVRADARMVFARAAHHSNPPGLSADFRQDDAISSGARWSTALINGSARVQPPPHGEAADIIVQDGCLKLRVRHDPNFKRKSSRWRKNLPAPEKYNNAYVVGLGGFMPAPGQALRIECRMKVSAGFHGSTGIWVQEAGTFDPKTGIMVKPFRSFGFSFLGEASDAYIRGLAAETVLGLSIQGKLSVPGFDAAGWHTYGLGWSWLDHTAQSAAFSVDGKEIGHIKLHPFGPGEIQLWADNYQIGRGMKIGFLNVPEMDETSYEWVRITTNGGDETGRS